MESNEPKPYDSLSKRAAGPRNWIAAIDLGTSNIGLTVIKPDEFDEKKLPYVEHSSLHLDSTGRGCKVYEERLLTELAYNWVLDRYERIFKHCAVVIIEKQMIPKPLVKEKVFAYFKRVTNARHCLMLEANLCAIFHSYIPLGGPYYIVKGPMWWKNKTNIPYNTERDKKGSTHKANKNSSMTVFSRKFGTQVVRDLKSRWGKIDDICDSYWIALAAYKDMPKLIKDYAFSNHTRDVNNTKKVITKDQRNIPIRPLDKPHKRKFSVVECNRMIRQQKRMKFLSS